MGGFIFLKMAHVKQKLLVTDKIDESGLKPLYKYFSVDIKVGLKPGDLAGIIANYDAVITRTSTPLPAEIIRKAKNLKVIGRAAIGVDNIDIFAATARKIGVINAPLGNSRVTAEHTIGLLFALLRNIPQAAGDLKKGLWNKQKYTGYQLMGKTLGIVGFGNVGKHVYKIARGIGLKVVVCEPYVRLPKKVRKATFEELLKDSDIITFHVPATYLTRKMFNKNTISFCRNGVYIINCSRGAVVDENAVKEGLKSGKIAGFAVDVFNREPEVDPQLLNFPNVIATPHIAGSTFESQKQSIQEVVSAVLQFIKGIPPANLVNPQVFKKKETGKKERFGFDAVIFDCDSTLSAIEGVDELAKWNGVGNEVVELTNDAMNGDINFEKVYDRRLKLIKPSAGQLIKLGDLYIKNLVMDAGEVISALKLMGIEVFMVSGGFSASLLILGKKLGIADKNIFGNDLIHDKNGNYLSMVEGPLRRNHGKLQIVRQIKGKKLVIGDSITDLETREYADLFVGYGGVVRREKVESGADIYLYHESLSPVIPISAGYKNTVKLLETKYAKYIGKAMDILFHTKHVRMDSKVSTGLSEFRKLAYY